MLHLQTIAPTGTKVGYSLRRRPDGLAYDAAANAFAAPPIKLPSVPDAPPAVPEEAAPYLGRFSLALPDATTSAWPDGIYEVWFHDAKSGVVIDGYLVEMISGDDTPKRDRPQVAPLPPGPAVPTLVNGGFASPVLPAKTNSSNPPDGWTATGPIGLATNRSPGTEGNDLAPDEGQFLVLPGGSTLSQTLAFPKGSFAVYVKWSMKSASKAHAFWVAIDGKPIATYSGPRLDFSGVMTPAFALEAGDHVVSFAGSTVLGPDACSLLDRVQVVRVS
jgi:hypothetical protein